MRKQFKNEELGIKEAILAYAQKQYDILTNTNIVNKNLSDLCALINEPDATPREAYILGLQIGHMNLLKNIIDPETEFCSCPYHRHDVDLSLVQSCGLYLAAKAYFLDVTLDAVRVSWPPIIQEAIDIHIEKKTKAREYFDKLEDIVENKIEVELLEKGIVPFHYPSVKKEEIN